MVIASRPTAIGSGFTTTVSKGPMGGHVAHTLLRWMFRYSDSTTSLVTVPIVESQGTIRRR